MSLYSVVLFIHVTAAVGVFAGMGPWLFGAAALRRARRVEQVRAVADVMTASLKLVLSGGLLLVGAGLYLALDTWSLRVGWIAVALVSVVLAGGLGGNAAESRLRGIVQAANEAPDGPLPPALAARVRDPLLGGVVQTQTAVFVGIIYLMTNKPGLGRALLVMAVSLVLGMASWLIVRRTSPGKRREDTPA